MSKEMWNEIRESILNDLIDDFHDRYNRYPTMTEEYELEMSITEDQLREAVSGRSEDSYEY